MTALSITNLCKQFGGLRVTANVSLAVAPGERRLIIGPNGAGKTTLFNLITGEIAPDSGSIRLFERDITRVSVHRRPHLGMARTYQIITLFANDTIVRNVTLALLGLSPLRWSLLRDLDTLHELVERAHAALARVGLAEIADRPLSQTSYGERRRVEIAMALAQEPKVLLLDEPFAGLSIDERRDVRQLLNAIPRDVSVVMIEHNMDVALDWAERITLLHFGEVIVEGTRAEVVANPRTREVYLGHSCVCPERDRRLLRGQPRPRAGLVLARRGTAARPPWAQRCRQIDLHECCGWPVAAAPWHGRAVWYQREPAAAGD